MYAYCTMGIFSPKRQWISCQLSTADSIFSFLFQETHLKKITVISCPKEKGSYWAEDCLPKPELFWVCCFWIVNPRNKSKKKAKKKGTDDSGCFGNIFHTFMFGLQSNLP